MKVKDRTNYRIVIDFNDHAVSRIRIKERDSNGKYVPIARPWGVKDLAAFKLPGKAVTLVTRGVADLDEICRTVTAPRRRKVGKKRLAEEAGALQTSGTGLRNNGPDKGVAHKA
jgi:hypothetical protein